MTVQLFASHRRAAHVAAYKTGPIITGGSA
jgi:hypothetical protein